MSKQLPFLDEVRHIFHDSHGTILKGVHTRASCVSPQACVIHHPSPHHMRDWPLVWNGLRRRFDRICPHGVAHPDPDDLAFQRDYAQKHSVPYFRQTPSASHLCDGCCAGI